MVQHYQDISYEGVDELANYKTRFRDGERPVLDDLGQVNLFIGPNNAGKSRFLRGLFKQESYAHVPTDFPLAELRRLLADVDSAIVDYVPRGVVGYGPVKRGMFESLTPQGPFLRPEDDFPSRALAQLRAVMELKSFNPIHSEGSHSPNIDAIRVGHDQVAKRAKVALGALEGAQRTTGGERRVYVPILRGLREFPHQPNAYQERTAKDYGLPVVDWAEVFTGHGLYGQLKALLLGDREKRTLVRRYEDFLSQEFFDGRQIQLVPRLEGDVVNVVIGDGEDRPIYDLGDGLQSIITITFPIFTASRRTLFFIEEPEVHLHPGMQRRLMELFSSPRLCHHQFFLTSHSNHLLDAAGDYGRTSVFLFRADSRLDRFQITKVQGSDRRVVRALGARSSSMYLTNAIVWVEGVTDRLYLRELLRRYLKDHQTQPPLKEDTHYVLAEVGGACVVHWDFSDSAEALAVEIRTTAICGDNFLVLDGDNADKGTRMKTFKAQLGEHFAILKGKEIENLLPQHAVRAAVASLNKAATPNQIELIQAGSYESQPVGLGTYLDSVIPGGGFSAPSGTIRRKVEFCHAACEAMRASTDWSLCTEASELCARIVAFVLGANGFSARR